MKRAFVLRLSEEADPSRGHVSGKIEEVDSGKSSTFFSIEEFLRFVQLCLEDNQKTSGS
jgi:hypothetical protein